MSIRIFNRKKIVIIFLVLAAILAGLGFLGWRQWKLTHPKPGSIKLGQSAPTTSTFDFHELGIKVQLPSEIKDLKYFDLVSADKTHASLSLYTDSYTVAAKNCMGVSGDGALPITLLNKYPGQYDEVKSTIQNFDLVKQLKDYFIASSPAFSRVCKDPKNQAEFNTYDAKIREAIKTTFSSAEAL